MKTISNRKRVELLFNASVAMWSLKILIESTNLDNREVEEVPDPCDLDMLLLDIEDLVYMEDEDFYNREEDFK
jgi:hypothetical protein